MMKAERCYIGLGKATANGLAMHDVIESHSLNIMKNSSLLRVVSTCWSVCIKSQYRLEI